MTVIILLLLSQTAVMGRVQGLWLINPKSLTEGERVDVRPFQGFENFYPGTILSVTYSSKVLVEIAKGKSFCLNVTKPGHVTWTVL